MNIYYKYLKYPNLYKYDFNFSKDLFFEYETKFDNSSFILSNKCRNAIYFNNIDKYIYINTLSETRIEDGFIINSIDCELLLINVGENVFYLASCNNNNKLLIHSMLYTFMVNHSCIIDINKYKHLFKNFFSIPLFIKTN